MASLKTLAMILAGAGSVYGATSSASAEVERKQKLVLTAPVPSGEFSIENTMGDVELIADASATEVRAEITKIARAKNEARAEKLLEEVTPTLELTGGTLKALYDAGSDREMRNESLSVDWRITAPPAVVLRLEVAMGDIEIKGFTRGATIESGMGDVDIDSLGGGVEIDSGMGDVDLGRVEGGVDIDSGMGDVSGKVSGRVKIESGQGSVTIELLAGAAQDAGDVDIDSGMGDIELTLPELGWGELDASVGMGNIDARLPAGIEVMKQGDDNDVMRARNPKGGPKVTLSSGMGDIDIRQSKGRVD